MSKINRWTEYLFANGLRAKNRVVVPPMASATASTDGSVTLQTLEHYQRLAESGAAMIFVEYTYIHSSGRGEQNQLGITSRRHVEGFKQIADLIKASGALAGIQLVHNGGKATSTLTGEELWGASEIQVPVWNQVMEVPRAISINEIQVLKDSYLAAAERASEAGFQMIEFHAAHGYGLNQWLSPVTNQRMDQYGGSLENRSRLLLEIIQLVRLKFPELILGVRIPGQDSHPGGLSSEDMIFIAQSLVAMGVDFLDVSSGIGGWRRPADRTGEGYLLPEAQIIQAKVPVPVIGVGGIKTGEFIDQILNKKMVGFAAVGRSILSDPLLFSAQVLNCPTQDRFHRC